jgi:hypothetical protein
MIFSWGCGRSEFSRLVDTFVGFAVLVCPIADA